VTLLILIVDVFYILGIGLISLCFGIKLFKILRYKFADSQEEVVFSSGLGLALLGYLVLGVGLCGLLYKSTMIILFVFLVITFYSEISYVFRNIKDYLGRLSPDKFFPRNRKILFLRLILFLSLIFGLIHNYNPPTTDDELMYHLSYPKIYVENHRIFSSTDFDFVAHYPKLVNMLYTLMLLLRGELAAKLTHYFLGILLLSSLYYFVKKYIGQKYGLLAIVLFYTMPMVTKLTGVAYNDFGIGIYSLLAFVSFVKWKENEYSVKWFYLSSLMIGFAFSGKYPPLGTFVSMVLIASWCWLSTKKQFVMNLHKLFIYAVIFVLPFVPWLLINLFFLKNPFYPFEVIKGIPYDECVKYWKEHATYIPNIKKVIFFPWHLYYGGFIWGSGPVIFAFLPLFSLLKGALKQVKFCFWFAIFNIITIFSVLQSWETTKYFILSYMLFSVVASYTIITHSENNIMLKRFIWLLLGIGLVFPNLSMNAYFAYKRVPFFLGRVSREEYIKKMYDGFEGYEVMNYCNENIPAKSRLLFLMMDGSWPFYYRQTIISGNKPSILALENTKEIIRYLKSTKIDYVVFVKQSHKHKWLLNADGSYTHNWFPFFRLNWFKNQEIYNYFEHVYTTANAVIYRIRN